MRVGYAVAGPEIINALLLLSLPLTVTAMAETAAVEVLKRHDELYDAVEITKTQRDRVCAELGAEKSYGNFVWLPRADAAEVETKMLDEGVVIRRYLDEGVRVSITDEAETTQFLEAWRRAGIQPWRRLTSFLLCEVRKESFEAQVERLICVWVSLLRVFLGRGSRQESTARIG